MGRLGPPAQANDAGVPSTPRETSECDAGRPGEDEARLIERAQGYLRALRRRDDPSPAEARGWDGFYAAYAPLVRRVARSRPVPRTDVQDRCQEIWRVVIVRLPGYRPDPARGPFAAWLSTVGRHALARLVLRLRGLTEVQVARLLDHDAPGLWPTPEQACARLQLAACVRAALDELAAAAAPPGPEVLRLRAIEGLSVGETAARLGLPPALVRDAHYRAKRRLRTILAPHAPNHGAGEGWAEAAEKIG